MSDVREPKRWIDDEQIQPANFSHAYSAHVATGPRAGQHAELWRELGDRLPTSLATAPSAAPAHSTLWSKCVLAAVGTSVIGVLWQATSLVHPSVPIATSGRPAQPAVPAPSPVKPAREVTETAPRESRSLAEGPGTEPPPTAATRKPFKSHARRAPSMPVASPAVQAAVSTPDDAQAELTLLLRARRVLESAPARALVLANEHAQQHPAGALAEEREVITIDALRQLGRIQEAQRRLQLFVERYPTSAYRARLIASLSPR
jgi:hypothetical protein